MKKIMLGIVITSCFIITSCRVTDFTVLSTKNVDIKANKETPRVKGWGFNIKDAIDKAIEKSPGSDALIDGVINRAFIGFTVKGTPVKTSEIKK